jgi:hypothetical protein
MMAKTAQTDFAWQVLDADNGVLTREYPFVKNATSRMMTARLKDGRLLAISPATGLTDADFKELEKHGAIGALIAPNSFHHLGLPSWTAAFPQATVYAPRTAHPRLGKKQPAARNLQPIEALAPLLPDNVRVHDVPGSKNGETWVTVRTARGPLWYVSDSCFSLAQPPIDLLPRLLFRLFDAAPGFRINGLGLKFFIKDRAGYRRWFLQQLEAELPNVVVTAHGAVVDAPGTGAELKRMAEAKL